VMSAITGLGLGASSVLAIGSAFVRRNRVIKLLMAITNQSLLPAA
jgi:hypothetical protein